LDDHVETLVFVIAFDQCGVETAMFGLRIPIGLENDFGQRRAVSGVRAPVTTRERFGREKDQQTTASAEETFAHEWLTVKKSLKAA
jgi:hypothetical protein